MLLPMTSCGDTPRSLLDVCFHFLYKIQRRCFNVLPFLQFLFTSVDDIRYQGEPDEGLVRLPLPVRLSYKMQVIDARRR